MQYPIERVYDTPVDILTMDDIIRDMSTHFNQQKKMTLASINPQIILMADSNPQVKAFIESASHRFADGIGVVKVSRWTKGQITERIAGIDVMVETLKYANQFHKKIFLYGAKPEVVEKAAAAIQKDYPHLEVAGYIDGYTTQANDEIVAHINQSGADMLFVALGSPKQEEWLNNFMPQLNCTVFQTVGGSLDVLSGTVRRAPEFFIKTNLEWVYRSFSHPSRLYRILQVPEFVGKSLAWNRKNKSDIKES